MKALKYCFPIAIALVGAAFSACSNDDALADNGNAGAKDNYLAVNIVNVGAAASTRATESYENGSDAEGNINSVRFYLFNQDGSPFVLANSSPVGVNWLTVNSDSIHTSEVTKNSGTVERMTNAVLIINGTNGRQPSSIVAVANPNAITDELGNGRKALSELTAPSLTVSSYAQAPYSTNSSEANFVMTNSVYNDSAAVKALTLTKDNFFGTADSARRGAVDIYVERVAAKVRVRHAEDNARWTTATTTLPGHTASGNYEAYNLNTDYSYLDGSSTSTISNVYAVFEGWGLTEQRSKASLEKNIEGITLTDTWNAPSYHRSFWEVIPQDGNTVVNSSFADIVNNPNGKNFSGSQYTMPNTPSTAATFSDPNRRIAVGNDDPHLTKVVLAAYLMRRDESANTWTPLEICQYRGQNFLDSANVKAAILSDLGFHILKGTTGSLSTLTADNIGFRVLGEPGTEDSYRVEPYLKGLSSGEQFYKYSGSVSSINDIPTDQLVAGATDADLQESTAPYVLIYNQGRTYYYTTIQHLWDRYGVVRNHLYDVNITGISGFGTPVYDPSQRIIPVTPVDRRTYVDASIKIIPWQTDTEDVNIDGNLGR